MPECANPSAPVVKCANCKKRIKTCERKKPVRNDYSCPAHPDGAELGDGIWVCSFECWDKMVAKYDRKLS